MTALAVALQAPVPLPLRGTGEAIRRVRKDILSPFRQSRIRLVCGEVGTGKRSCAAAMHAVLGHGAGELVSFDAAALRPEQLWKAILKEQPHGHKYRSDRCGHTVIIANLERAESAFQARLANLFEDGTTTSGADVRLILLTSDLSRLWPDLRYRLAETAIELPPLRERPEDFVDCVASLVSEFRGQIHAPEEIFDLFSPSGISILQHYTWPGNLLELRSVLNRALRESRPPLGETVPAIAAIDRLARPSMSRPRARSVSPASGNLPNPPQGNHSGDSTPSGLASLGEDLKTAEFWQLSVTRALDEMRTQLDKRALLGETVGAVETGLISAVLSATAGNIAQSARLLGITRVSLRRKIHALKLSIPNRHSSEKPS